MALEKKQILVIGLGGVGTIASYTLQQNPDVEVSTIVRSDYDRVINDGYNIDSVDYGVVTYKPAHVFKSLSEATESQGEFDYVVVTVKNTPDIQNVEDIYQDAITPGKTVIVLLQNGIGIEKAAFARFPSNIILSGISMISSINTNGNIQHVGTDDLAVGYFNNTTLDADIQESKRDEFVGLYSNEHNNCYIDNDVKYRRWRKLVYNATFNSLCAITDLDVGRIQEFGGTKDLVIPAMDEVFKVAKSDGVELTQDIKDAMIHSDDGVWYAPSMCVDVRKGNQIELEVIVGNTLKIARENNVETPILNVIYSLLKLLQWRLKEKNGRIELPEKRPVPTRDLTQ
jgi:2-dehydropantoate 2-reductase